MSRRNGVVPHPAEKKALMDDKKTLQLRHYHWAKQILLPGTDSRSKVEKRKSQCACSSFQECMSIVLRLASDPNSVEVVWQIISGLDGPLVCSPRKQHLLKNWRRSSGQRTLVPLSYLKLLSLSYRAHCYLKPPSAKAAGCGRIIKAKDT